MAVFTPKGGRLTSVKVTLGGTVTLGQLLKNSSGTAVVQTGATIQTIGIAAESGVSGDVIGMYLDGIFEVTDESGGFSMGDQLAWAAAHTVDPAASTEIVIGMALETTATGATGLALINLPGHIKA